MLLWHHTQRVNLTNKVHASGKSSVFWRSVASQKRRDGHDC